MSLSRKITFRFQKCPVISAQATDHLTTAKPTKQLLIAQYLCTIAPKWNIQKQTRRANRTKLITRDVSLMTSANEPAKRLWIVVMMTYVIQVRNKNIFLRYKFLRIQKNNSYHSYYFVRHSNWPRGDYVTANNCQRTIVLLQMMVCSCAVQSTSDHNGSAFLRVIRERFYLLNSTKGN